MNRIVVLVGLAVVLILGVEALGAAQDATPEAGTTPNDVCATPVGSPAATPVDEVLVSGIGTIEASPEASPGATPAVLFVCATPGVGTPVTAGDAAIEASPV
jgi:hypothetical protein